MKTHKNKYQLILVIVLLVNLFVSFFLSVYWNFVNGFVDTSYWETRPEIERLTDFAIGIRYLSYFFVLFSGSIASVLGLACSQRLSNEKFYAKSTTNILLAIGIILTMSGLISLVTSIVFVGVLWKDAHFTIDWFFLPISFEKIIIGALVILLSFAHKKIAKKHLNEQAMSVDSLETPLIEK